MFCGYEEMRDEQIGDEVMLDEDLTGYHDSMAFLCLTFLRLQKFVLKSRFSMPAGRGGGQLPQSRLLLVIKKCLKAHQKRL